jgi:hypothetical protein
MKAHQLGHRATPGEPVRNTSLLETPGIDASKYDEIRGFIDPIARHPRSINRLSHMENLHSSPPTIGKIAFWLRFQPLYTLVALCPLWRFSNRLWALSTVCEQLSAK